MKVMEKKKKMCSLKEWRGFVVYMSDEGQRLMTGLGWRRNNGASLIEGK